MCWNSKTLSALCGGLIFLEIAYVARGQLSLNRIGYLETLGNKQYFIENTAKVNWHKAVQICNSLGMTLASIESQDEQRQLKSFMYLNSALSDQYWLSGNDLSQSREFVWHGTGKKMTYTSWAINPGTNSQRRCIHTNSNFNWLRDSCLNEHYFICERPVLPECGANGSCDQKPLIIY